MHRSIFSVRANRFHYLLFGISAAVSAQDPPLSPDVTSGLVPTAVPEVPLTSRQPASYYASSGATTSSAFVHDQVAAFWGVDSAATGTNPFHWGPFRFLPFASYRFTYGDGISVTPGNQVTTALNEITPGAVLQSQHLSFRYAPTLRYYSAHEFEDGVDHAASANVNFGVDDWMFTLGHSYSKTTSPLIETAAQTPQQSHNTIASAVFRYSDRISFDFTLSQAIQETDSLNSSIGWSSMNWANYHWTEKASAGLGLGGGYTKQDFGADMTHEQIQGRISWNPGLKLSVGLNGGVEFRQFIDADLEDEMNPIFGGLISYTPWEATTFSLSANQSVGTSLLDAQATETISIFAGLRQRLLSVLHLDLFGSIMQQDYQSVSTQGAQSTLETSRSDDILSFSANLGCRLFKKGDISIFYQHSQNESSLEDFTYNSDQYGFQIAYRF